MPPYGLYSLENTPEELLNRGYGPVNTEFAEDPAFGNLTYNTSYYSTPYTGAIPFQNVFRIDEGVNNNFENPSPYGISGYRDTGGIMNITPQQNFEFLSSAYEDESDEQDQEYIGQVNQSNNKLGGIIDLLAGIAIPGYGIFKNVAQGGFEELRGLAGRLGQSDFGSSRTGAEFFQKLRDRRAREEAAQRGADKQRIQDLKAFNEGAGQYFSGSNDNVGSQQQAGPGFSGSGSADEMGSF